MSETVDRRALHDEANRIGSKISAAIDGEQSLPTLYALLSLAAHCAEESKIPEGAAASLFAEMLRISHGVRR